MTNLEETALREEWGKEIENEMPTVFIIDGEKEIADWWLKKMKEHDSAEKSRIASRIEHMFVNAPETYHAIKQIIYS